MSGGLSNEEIADAAIAAIKASGYTLVGLCATCAHFGDGRKPWTEAERAEVDSGTCLLLSDANNEASAAIVGPGSVFVAASFGCTEHRRLTSEDRTP